MTMKRLLLTLLTITTLALPAMAATLRVAPVSLELRNGTSTSSVRVWNDDREPLHVQVRIFKWTVEKGQNVLKPTTDVVVSPPMTTLQPGSENIIRVVRVSKSPVQGTEQYRLIIDQLPDPAKRRPGTVNVLVRHAIPVTFE